MHNSGTDVPSLNLNGMKFPSDQMLQHLQGIWGPHKYGLLNYH